MRGALAGAVLLVTACGVPTFEVTSAERCEIDIRGFETLEWSLPVEQLEEAGHECGDTLTPADYCAVTDASLDDIRELVGDVELADDCRNLFRR